MRALKDKRALRSFSLALAGTLGVGNVFGVAFGILVGGAGSLFWLFVSMIFAMIIKYAEVVISSDNLHHDREAHGGMFFVIAKSFGSLGKPLSRIYAFCALGLSLFMGAALQCGSVSSAAFNVCGVSKVSVALFLCLLSFAAIVGGARKIERITAIVIPLTTIIYITATFYIIITRIDLLPRVIRSVIISAFSGEGMLGGAVAFLLSPAFREGFARGILSNEAGAGTSSIAHARNGVLNPASSGLLGMLEVWFDTGLLCMLTGLSILLCFPDTLSILDGMSLIMYVAGSVFGVGGKWCALLLVFCFAFATVICWYYYGIESWGYALGKTYRMAYLPMFLLFVFLGAFFEDNLTVFVVDALMTVISALCLSALIKSSDRIKALSERGGVVDSDLCRRYLGRVRFKGSVLRKERERQEH